jgi:hypothetical protein
MLWDFVGYQHSVCPTWALKACGCCTLVLSQHDMQAHDFQRMILLLPPCYPYCCCCCWWWGCPSQIPPELRTAAVPLLFICPGRDRMFHEKTQSAAEQMLEQQSPGKLLVNIFELKPKEHQMHAAFVRRQLTVCRSQSGCCSRAVVLFVACSALCCLKHRS